MIKLGAQQSFAIGEWSAIAAVRRAGNSLARQLGFNDVRSGELALIITEAATNIVKHAEHGQILLRPMQNTRNSGVEVIAVDAGPGIANLPLQMQDGNSTAGSYGVGLGAIYRLSQQFDAYSTPGNGTVLWAVIWSDAAIPPDCRWEVGAIRQPYPGEEVCGDAWTVEIDDSTATLMVADGLGHGPDAAVASEAAAIAVSDAHKQRPGELLRLAHVALHGTRGAAVAIGQVELCGGTLTFAGIGNIAASMVEAGESSHRHLLSHNGIVGSNLRKVQEFCHPWVEGSMLIFHSDGINTRWDLNRYPGLIRCHPGVIATVLYRDFVRGRDDISVVVLRETRTFS